MSKPKAVYNLFLASPGDVPDERRISREIVARVNRAIGRGLDCEIDIFGWEDVAPAFGRPQAVINRDIETCDIFVGVVHARWGSETGLHTSGFEEEFVLAKKLREAHGKPEIWLYFKNVDAVQVKDPGPQLSKVLEFKTTRISNRDVLFKEYLDAATWQLMIFEHLSGFLINNSKQQEDKSNQTKRLPIKATPSLKKTPTSVQVKDDARRQIIDTLENMVEIMKVEPDFQGSIPDSNYNRISLLIKERNSIRDEDYSVGTHEIQALYKEKTSLKLSQREASFLLKVLVSNKSDLIPGWYFFRNIPEHLIDDLVFRLLGKEFPSHLRENAADFILSMELKLSDEAILKADALSKIELPEDKRSAIVSHIQRYENISTASSIARFQSKFASKFDPEHYLKEIGNDPIQALEKLDQATLSTSEVRRVIWLIEPLEADVPTGVLRRFATSNLEEIRFLCFKFLSNRKELTTEDLDSLKSSTEYRFRVLNLELESREFSF